MSEERPDKPEARDRGTAGVNRRDMLLSGTAVALATVAGTTAKPSRRRLPPLPRQGRSPTSS